MDDKKNSGFIAGVKVCDRDVLYAFAGCIGLALFWQKALSFAWRAGVAQTSDLSVFCVGEWLTVAVIFWIIRQLGEDGFLSRKDLVILVASSLTFVFPRANASIAPITAGACLFLWRKDERLASLGQLLLALAFYETFAQLLFDFTLQYILPLEAALAGAVLSCFDGFSRDGLVINGPNNHSILLKGGCSVFNNAVVATMLWLALNKLDKFKLGFAAWRVLAVMIGVAIMLNTARLVLMAQSYPLYDYWHNRAGATIFSIALLAAVLGVFLGARELEKAG